MHHSCPLLSPVHISGSIINAYIIESANDVISKMSNNHRAIDDKIDYTAVLNSKFTALYHELEIQVLFLKLKSTPPTGPY